MTISPADAVGHVDHAGQTYYFCNEGCLEQFRADPERFIDPEKKQKGAAVADPEAEYTCPMHPEVRQRGPGSCPICGMALEPVAITLEDQPNEELDRHDAAVPMVARAHRADSRVHDRRVRFPASRCTIGCSWALNWLELALAYAVVLWGGVAILSARLGLDRQPPSEHVYADRPWCGLGVRL